MTEWRLVCEAANHEVPTALDALSVRSIDGCGYGVYVSAPDHRYWQMQCPHRAASVDDDALKGLFRGYAIVKKAAALVNEAAGLLSGRWAAAIIRAADEAIDGRLDNRVGPYVWQAASGTYADAKINVVLATRASQLLGDPIGTEELIAADVHVNMGQLCIDGGAAAANIACLTLIDELLMPKLAGLFAVLQTETIGPINSLCAPASTDRACAATVAPECLCHSPLGGCIAALERSRALFLELPVNVNGADGSSGGWEDKAADLIGRIAHLTGASYRARRGGSTSSPLAAIVSASEALRDGAVFIMEIAKRLRAIDPHNDSDERRTVSLRPGPSGRFYDDHRELHECIVTIAIRVIADSTATAVTVAKDEYEAVVVRSIVLSNITHSVVNLAEGCERLRTLVMARNGVACRCRAQAADRLQPLAPACAAETPFDNRLSNGSDGTTAGLPCSSVPHGDGTARIGDMPASGLRAIGLTHREHQIVPHLAYGLTNKAIGRELGIAPETVKTHLRSIFNKLDVRSRAGAAARLALLTYAPEQ